MKQIPSVHSDGVISDLLHSCPYTKLEELPLCHPTTYIEEGKLLLYLVTFIYQAAEDTMNSLVSQWLKHMHIAIPEKLS